MNDHYDKYNYTDVICFLFANINCGDAVQQNDAQYQTCNDCEHMGAK